MSEWADLYLGIIACFFGGMMASLSGGAGLIAVPTLVFLRVSPLNALATNKLISSFSNIISALMLKRSFNFKKNFLLLLLVFLSSIFGALFIRNLISQEKIKPLIAILLMALALKNLFYFKINLFSSKLKPSIKNKRWISYGIFSFMGIYSGAIGLGAGPFFLMLGKYFFRLKNLEASAFAKISVLFTNVPSFLIFAFVFGNVDYKLGIPMAISSMMGTYLGTKIFNKMTEKLLNSILFSIVFFIGLFMLIKR